MLRREGLGILRCCHVTRLKRLRKNVEESVRVAGNLSDIRNGCVVNTDLVVKLQVLTAASMKMTAFCNIAYCLHL
jgi:hypothetical protein